MASREDSDVEPSGDECPISRRSRSRLRYRMQGHETKQMVVVKAAKAVANEAIPLGMTRQPTRPAKPFSGTCKPVLAGFSPLKALTVASDSPNRTISVEKSMKIVTTSSSSSAGLSGEPVLEPVPSSLDPAPFPKLIPIDVSPSLGVLPDPRCPNSRALFPLRAHDINAAIKNAPHQTPSQIATNLGAKFNLTSDEQQTVRLMASSAIVARQDVAAEIRRTLCSGNAFELDQLKSAMGQLAGALDSHPFTQLGD